MVENLQAKAVECMTWRQFVDRINMLIESAAIDQDTPIWYVDVTMPQAEGLDEPEVSLDETLGLCITNH